MLQRFARWWRVFKKWRRTRPFWAGVFGLVSAAWLIVPIASFEIGTITLTLQTPGGRSGVLIAVVVACCAIGVWVRPEFRLVCGVVTFIASLMSLPAVNLGGFGVGMLCGLVSAALMIAWSSGTTGDRRGPSGSEHAAHTATQPQALEQPRNNLAHAELADAVQPTRSPNELEMP